MNCSARPPILWALHLLPRTAAGRRRRPRSAQTTLQNYRCADGTEFIVGFFQYDKRAHVQMDGKAVTLAKRLALTGSRYSGGGVTLRVTKAGAPRSSTASGR